MQFTLNYFEGTTIFLANLCNYFSIILILYFLMKKKKINNIYIFVAFCISGLLPFFFNNFLFDWFYMYDQIKYVKGASDLRRFNFAEAELEFGDYTSSTRWPTIIFSLTPIPFIVNVQSLGFANKLIYFVFVLYLYRNVKIDKLTIIFLIIYPSAVIYTSLSLRDPLVAIFFSLSLIFFIEKKFYLLLIFSFLLFLVKKYLLLFLVFIFVSKYLYDRIIERKCILTIFFLVLFLILLNYINGLQVIVEIFNTYARGLYIENYKTLEGFKDFSNIFEIFFNILQSSLKSFFRPSDLTNNNIFENIQFIENILLNLFLVYIFYKSFRESAKVTFFWFLILIFIMGIYSLAVVNHGSFVRYKFTIILAVILALRTSVIRFKNYKYL
jgi:hypothetical protein